MRRSMSLLRGQKTAQMPQVQFTEKLVDGRCAHAKKSNSAQ